MTAPTGKNSAPTSRSSHRPPDLTRREWLAEGDRIAAIGPTDEALEQYRQAEVYDGRGKALFPGLIKGVERVRRYRLVLPAA